MTVGPTFLKGIFLTKELFWFSWNDKGGDDPFYWSNLPHRNKIEILTGVGLYSGSNKRRHKSHVVVTIDGSKLMKELKRPTVFDSYFYNEFRPTKKAFTKYGITLPSNGGNFSIGGVAHKVNVKGVPEAIYLSDEINLDYVKRVDFLS